MSYIYINEDDIDYELKCIICNNPFEYPVNCTKCGHTFCRECIHKWQQQQNSCPSCRGNQYTFPSVISRALNNQLNRLLVQCPLCQQTNIQRSDLVDHVSYQCPKQIINCTNRCGWDGCREDLQQHLRICGRKLSEGSQFTRCSRCFASIS